VITEAPTDETAASAQVIRWGAWVLSASLVIAGILFGLVQFGAIEGPGPPPGVPNEYPTQLGYFFADERVVFPYEVAGALLFSLGFLAFAAIGLGLRNLTGTRDPIGTIVAACFAFAAGLLVVSQLIFIGAKQVAIDKALCDCRWATEQVISQHRTLEMVYGINEWLVAGSLFLAGLGMLAIPALVTRQPPLPIAWARASQALAVIFFVAVLAVCFQVDIVFELIAAIGSVLLLPAWALWLDRRIHAGSSSPSA
jgi:hypothetical protein